ncbi:MAG: helix-turn-helix transcriptional regulator [Desulfosporosinus sp.]|nr:helix-turn-helix transcriptional regulator [Desulfosporosinus sp.]
MIKTEKEYQELVLRLENDLQFIELQREHFIKMELTDEQVKKALEPSICFHEQLREEVEHYEKIKRGEFTALENFDGMGRFLIGLRIYLGITQSELATRLEVAEAQISRDEKNEYHGASIEKVKRILEALSVTVSISLTRIPEKIAV